jgi:hypothetical protein
MTAVHTFIPRRAQEHEVVHRVPPAHPQDVPSPETENHNTVHWFYTDRACHRRTYALHGCHS